MTRLACFCAMNARQWLLALVLIVGQWSGLVGQPAAASAQTDAFYHLQIEYITASDWTSLELHNPERVLSVRTVEVSPAATFAEASTRLISMSQELARAEGGANIRMIVDVALAAEALDQPLEFLLLKGGLNWVTIDVFALNDGRRVRLGHVYHEHVPADPGLNPLEFDIDLAPLQSLAPEDAAVVRFDTPRLLWAFYYPWYRVEDWNSPVLADHPSQPYTSRNPRATIRQIEQAQAAGIDGFISSWWGPGDYTDDNLKTLLQLAEARDFRVAIYFETLAEEGPRGAQELYDWLSYFITTYRDHPAYMRIDGKPVIVVWVSFTVPLETWADVFARLRAEGLDAFYLAMGYDNIAALEIFDGLHEYGVFPIANLEAVATQTGLATHYYGLLEETPTPRLWAATVQPGYDDRLLPGREGQVQDREGGAFYRGTFEAALASDPDWIFITSWNEWWENTHIEPSETYGELYLDITREYAARWKGLP